MASTFLQRHAKKSALMPSYGRYESDLAVSQYCDAHYGPDKFGVTNFPLQLAQLCANVMEQKPRNHALDLGCSVGRACFELAPHFAKVTGIDFSRRFIEKAQRIKENGTVSYKTTEEGEFVTDQRISLADLNLSKYVNKVEFFQGNAQQLNETLTNFDLILVANLIDRLPDPGAFLSDIHRRLVKGGILVIASPNSWQEYFTPRNKWLGGQFRRGVPVSSMQGLCEKLAKHFSMAREPQDIEFVIRQNARVFNHSISQVTFWQRER